MSTAVSPAPSARSRRQARRNAKKASGRGLRIFLWIVACLTALVLVGWFSFSAWLRSYLRGESFRRFLSAKISSTLNAEGSIDNISWRDSAAWVDQYKAEGYTGAAFHTLSVQDVRAGISTGAIWDRIWKIDNVTISRLRIDATESRKTPPPPEPQPSGAGGSSPGWFSRFIPNRTVLGEISVSEAEAVWTEGSQTVQISKLPLSLRTNDTHDAATVSGRGGEMTWTGLPGMKFRLDAIDFTARSGEVRIDRLTAESTGSERPVTRLTADALITGSASDTRLDVNGKISGLDVQKIIPENWIQRLTGSASLDGKVSGTMQKKDSLFVRGRFSLTNGGLQALPMLEIIARKTRNEAFAHLMLKEASADCMWSTRLLGLDRIFVDCPGLLRLRGHTTIMPDDSLSGDLLVGIAPKSLSYIAGAEDYVFLPLDKLNLSDTEKRLVNSEDQALRWARLRLGGILSNPKEDLSDRLARAWFNATVDQVLNMSMEEAIQRAEQISRAAADLAGKAMEKGGEAGGKLLEQAPELLEKGIDAGGKAVESGADLINGLLNGK